MIKKYKSLIILAFIFFITTILLFFINRENENKFSINKNLNSLNLITHEGKTLKFNETITVPSIFFFGFLNCPDICPNTLVEISEIIKSLGNDSKKISFFFVTVDPERDTAVNMKKYLNNFNNQIIGVTGRPEKIGVFLKEMHVYYKKIYLDDDFYTLDHASQLLIFKKGGDFFGTISLEENKDIVLKKIKSVI